MTNGSRLPPRRACSWPKAHRWEEPLRVHHTALERSQCSCILASKTGRTGRSSLHESLDVAVILIRRPNFGEASFPQELVQCIPSGQAVHRGIEVGWLGYPYLVDDGTRCCFFSGNISAFANGRYFIDGVAIEGVSGGPAFYTKDDEVYIIGCISEYKSANVEGDRPGPWPARC